MPFVEESTNSLMTRDFFKSSGSFRSKYLVTATNLLFTYWMGINKYSGFMLRSSLFSIRE